MKDFMMEKLFEVLGIAKYLEEKECSDRSFPIANALNGWTSGANSYFF